MSAANRIREGAERRLAEARTACFEGRTDSARTAYKDAKAAFEKLDDLQGVADALSERGCLESMVARPDAGQQLLKEALELSTSEGDSKRRALHLVRLGDLEAARGHCDAAKKRYEESRVIYRELSDEFGEALTWRGAGELASAMSDFDEARDCFDRAYPLHQTPSHFPYSAMLLRCSGDLERRMDRHDEAEAMYLEARAHYSAQPVVERGYLHFGLGETSRMRGRSNATPDHKTALQLFEACQHRSGMGAVYCALGEAARVAGDGPGARAAFETAMEHLKFAGHRLGMGNAYRGLGLVERNLGNYPEARRAYREAKVWYQSARHILGEAHVLRGIGDIDYLQDHDDDAGDNLNAALARYKKVGSRLGEANTLLSLGDLARTGGNARRAGASYLRAKTLYEEIGDKTGVANATKSLAYLDLVAGHNAEALKGYRKTLAAFQKLNVPSGVAESHRGLAEAQLALKELKYALDHCDAALKIFHDIEQELGYAQTLQVRGEVLMAMGNRQDAFKAFSKAATAFDVLGDRAEQEACLSLAQSASPDSPKPMPTGSSAGIQDVKLVMSGVLDRVALKSVADKYGGELESVSEAAVTFSGMDTTRLLEDAESGRLDGVGGAPGVLEVMLLDGECLFEKLPDVASSTPASIDVDDKKLSKLLERTDVLIVTSAEIERRAVLSRLIPLKGETSILVGSRENVTYSIGQFGRYAAAHVHTTQGPDGRHGATLTLADALRGWNCKACFVIGIAFGFDRKTQRMGDVLIAEIVQPYEHAKIEGQTETYKPRGLPIPCSTVLSERFRNRMGDWVCRRAVTQVALHQGTVLSGAKLVNSKPFRDRLYEQFKEQKPVGGEMEGHATYAAAQVRHVEIILVKAICDWADGDKNDRAQHFAVDMAVDACHHLLSKPNVLSDLEAKDLPRRPT